MFHKHLLLCFQVCDNAVVGEMDVAVRALGFHKHLLLCFQVCDNAVVGEMDVAARPIYTGLYPRLSGGGQEVAFLWCQTLHHQSKGF